MQNDVSVTPVFPSALTSPHSCRTHQTWLVGIKRELQIIQLGALILTTPDNPHVRIATAVAHPLINFWSFPPSEEKYLCKIHLHLNEQIKAGHREVGTSWENIYNEAAAGTSAVFQLSHYGYQEPHLVLTDVNTTRRIVCL